MNDYFIYSIGLIAQLLFSLRLLVQWLFSEKENKVVTPILFWIVSLIASFLFFIYGYLRNDFAIMLGQFITYYIYIRNLQLQNQWNRLQKGIQIVFINFPLIVLLITFLRGEFDFSQLFNQDFIPIWLLALGIVSQLIFTLRFIFQWIISEKNKLSQLPSTFWILSTVGSVIILIYSIFRKDPILFIGHTFGIIIYCRNLMILKKHN
ncbi:lipid-A-disaccharide synthase N-terminal domain-containing protein [bacterium]|nr:lipid-A-disaccharide synthase N-terminal domain-containing protein [bacterium]